MPPRKTLQGFATPTERGYVRCRKGVVLEGSRGVTILRASARVLSPLPALHDLLPPLG